MWKIHFANLKKMALSKVSDEEACNHMSSTCCEISQDRIVLYRKGIFMIRISIPREFLKN